ncbi:MAG TPA: formate--tetrahydrofolate ligase [Synergistaceae bacterium]|nr:formate--tetrahydrofolate ligase [Synergistaceae bacterium]HQF90988.1 formate--tetrahydrofolate ligase [Synergistaceae bacterium]HQH77960.1 formate--tetrahydrofolate ligase [Synergistaceae bacterium]HQK25413.1 formate--tetrahydrofolate ligase [Synergistaceae bacterium]
MASDLEIAQKVSLKPIMEIGADLGIPAEAIIPYGHYKAKVDLRFLKTLKDRPEGRLILVTATTPTAAGEGKTTNTIGLTQALVKMGKKAMICLREPSLGPCFGVKGGAAGGGWSQVLPMEDINLHFTGDIHAVGTAHNLLAAMLDNHLQQGNALGIDPRTITLRRAMDMNERALRHTVIGLGGKAHGVPRETGFDITVASEVMAILCLAEDLMDLKERLGRIVVGLNFKGEYVTAADLKAHGAMASLLKEAINPNLVQTIEHVPAFVHGGPFANIAHGTNSLVATRAALKLADYAVVEAGFASDLGAEKFMDIACLYGRFSPSAVVLVTTVRALKLHGGAPKDQLGTPDPDALRRGLPNLEAHLDNLNNFGVPVVVALNRFSSDSDEELALVREAAASRDARIALSEVWEKGGEGGLDLAREVLAAMDQGSAYRRLYGEHLPLKDKIGTIVTRVYGAEGVDFIPSAAAKLEELEQRGYGTLPVCMAKTQMSLTDDASKKGRPRGFRVTVREVRLSAGAGFVVAICGDIMTMPGLPKSPAAERIDIDSEGNITGLF